MRRFRRSRARISASRELPIDRRTFATKRFSWNERLIGTGRETMPARTSNAERCSPSSKRVFSRTFSCHSRWLIYRTFLVAVQIPPSLGGCSTGRLLHFCLETSSRSLARVEVVFCMPRVFPPPSSIDRRSSRVFVTSNLLASL